MNAFSSKDQVLFNKKFKKIVLYNVMTLIWMNETTKHCDLAMGAVPSPFDCYLLNRGLKTLALRMQAHMKNGLHIAHWLEKNPRVTKVIHPGTRASLMLNFCRIVLKDTLINP